MSRLALIVLLALVSGCGTMRPVSPAAVPPATKAETPEQAEARRALAARPTYNLTGYPPAVRDGYIDGCESAKGTRFGRKDAARMASDAQYSMGWNDGFSICKKQ